MAKRKRKLKFGDLVQITALDHCSTDDGWKSAPEMLRETPSRLVVTGTYIGSTPHAHHVTMAKADDSYGVSFMVLKGAIEKIEWLK